MVETFWTCPNANALEPDVGVSSQSFRLGPKRPPVRPPRSFDEVDWVVMDDVEASYATISVTLVAETFRSSAVDGRSLWRPV